MTRREHQSIVRLRAHAAITRLARSPPSPATSCSTVCRGGRWLRALARGGRDVPCGRRGIRVVRGGGLAGEKLAMDRYLGGGERGEGRASAGVGHDELVDERGE